MSLQFCSNLVKLDFKTISRKKFDDLVNYGSIGMWDTLYILKVKLYKRKYFEVLLVSFW